MGASKERRATDVCKMARIGFRRRSIACDLFLSVCWAIGTNPEIVRLWNLFTFVCRRLVSYSCCALHLICPFEDIIPQKELIIPSRRLFLSDKTGHFKLRRNVHFLDTYIVTVVVVEVFRN